MVVQGSLTNDVVWEKSDIDATVVVRDQKITVRNFCLDADGIVMNMYVIDRSDYVRMLERGLGGSMSQSFNSHSKVMYTTDTSITEMVEKNKIIGERDAERSAFFIACDVICLMEKCEKWLYVKKDLPYCRYYILKTAESLARLEICLNKEAPLREVIQRAGVLNPALVDRFYNYPLNNTLGEKELEELIFDIDKYLMDHIEVLSNQVVEYLDDGEIKTVNMFAREFHSDGHFIVHILEYFVSKGIIDKVSQTIRITPKSRPILEEIAYMKKTNF